MAETTTFKVSKKGFEAVQCTLEVPENIDDPKWDDLVSAGKEDIHSLALQALIIRIQAAGRGAIEQGPEAVQAAVDRYKFGARSGGFRAPTLAASTAKDLKFTKAQLAALAAAGVKLGSEEDEG